MTRHDEQLAEEYGYVRYRCPHCKKVFYGDAGPECPRCGPEEVEDEQENGQ